MKNVLDLFVFELELMPVVHMLILATGAVGIIRTARIDPMRRCSDDAHEIGGGVAFLDLNDFHFDAFAGKNERHEHDKPVAASDSVSAKRDVGNLKFAMSAGLQDCRHDGAR